MLIFNSGWAWVVGLVLYRTPFIYIYKAGEQCMTASKLKTMLQISIQHSSSYICIVTSFTSTSRQGMDGYELCCIIKCGVALGNILFQIYILYIERSRWSTLYINCLCRYIERRKKKYRNIVPSNVMLRCIIFCC